MDIRWRVGRSATVVGHVGASGIWRFGGGFCGDGAEKNPPLRVDIIFKNAIQSYT